MVGLKCTMKNSKKLTLKKVLNLIKKEATASVLEISSDEVRCEIKFASDDIAELIKNFCSEYGDILLKISDPQKVEIVYLYYCAAFDRIVVNVCLNSLYAHVYAHVNSTTEEWKIAEKELSSIVDISKINFDYILEHMSKEVDRLQQDIKDITEFQTAITKKYYYKQE